jgi:anti-sigma B factor antagonist
MSDATSVGNSADTSTSGPVKLDRSGAVRIVAFVQSKILDEANITEIGGQVNAVIDAESKPRVLIDFASVDHLSSAALGMLINANQRIREKNGELRLCDIKKQILEVFAITKLDKLFKIYPDRATALQSFGVQKTDV